MFRDTCHPCVCTQVRLAKHTKLQAHSISLAPRRVVYPRPTNSRKLGTDLTRTYTETLTFKTLNQSVLDQMKPLWSAVLPPFVLLVLRVLLTRTSRPLPQLHPQCRGSNSTGGRGRGRGRGCTAPCGAVAGPIGASAKPGVFGVLTPCRKSQISRTIILRPRPRPG